VLLANPSNMNRNFTHQAPVCGCTWSEVGDAGGLLGRESTAFQVLAIRTFASRVVCHGAAYWHPGPLVFGPGSPPVANAVRGSRGYFPGAFWPEDGRRFPSTINVSTARRGAT